MKCLVCGAERRSTGITFITSGISFHRFPSDVNRTREWLQCIGKPINLAVTLNDGVCSRHFSDSNYHILPTLTEDIDISQRRTPLLKPTAKPTLDEVFERNWAAKRPRSPSEDEPMASAEATSSKRRSSSSDHAYSRSDSDESRPSSSLSSKSLETAQSVMLDSSSVQLEDSNVPVLEDSQSVSFLDSADVSQIAGQFHSAMTIGALEDVELVCGQSNKAKPQTKHKYVQTLMFKGKSKSTQSDFRPKLRDKGVQCDPRLTSSPNLSPIYKNITDCEEIYSEETSNEDDEQAVGQDSDPTFDPEETFTSSVDVTQNFEELFNQKTAELEDKFIVFESCLMILFKFCMTCRASVTSIEKTVCGSALSITTTCVDGHVCKWHSQTKTGKMFWGNIILASVLFYMGNLPHKLIRTLKMARIAIFVERTYFYYQRVLVSVIQKVWKDEQQALLDEQKGKSVVICGDGRADPPGHTAKYGTYTFMDGESKKILHLELVQSTEVKNSYHMEKEGLQRGLTFLIDYGISISSIVTDRHVSIIKFIREAHPTIKHYFDGWHVAKGISKQLTSVASKKGGEILTPWIPGISNHIYWCATSTTIPGTIRDKWQSLLRHIANEHEGHPGTFTNCLHGPLVDHEERLWIHENTVAHTKISSIVNNPRLLSAIDHLSPHWQTSSVEAFHSVLLSKCPKRIHFFYDSMLGRNLLAVLHYNENGNKAQDVTSTNELRWDVVYPKAKQGQAVAKPVLEPSTYVYIDTLLRETMKTFASRETLAELIPPSLSPGLLSHQHSEGVEKAEVIQKHTTRFPKK